MTTPSSAAALLSAHPLIDVIKMKKLLLILTLIVACSFNLCAETPLLTAKFTIEADGELLFSPTVQGRSGERIQFEVGEVAMSNGDIISRGGTLDITATVLEKEVSFEGVITAKGKNGQGAKETIHVNAVTKKEFQLSGECLLNEKTNITLQGNDGVTYELSFLFSDAEPPKYKF